MTVTAVLLDTAASLWFELLKLFEELKYAELCLKLNYILSCSCSIMWWFWAIWVVVVVFFFSPQTIKKHPIQPCCFKAWVFHFCEYFKQGSLKSIKNQLVSLSTRLVCWKHCKCHMKRFDCTGCPKQTYWCYLAFTCQVDCVFTCEEAISFTDSHIFISCIWLSHLLL